MLSLTCVFAGCECISVEREFLERLYMENRELMYVVARRYASSAADVDDIVSAGITKLISHVQEFMDMECHALKAYVVITVKHAGIDHARRARRELPHTGDRLIDNVQADGDVDAGLIGNERLCRLRDALRKLSEKDRTLLEMKYFLEYDDAAIAEYMDVKQDSVRQMLRRARRRLALEMEDYENDEQ